MAYSSGIMNKRVTIAQKSTAADGAFGRNSAGVTYYVLGTVWAAVDFVKGIKAMREGAIDAYDTVMVRMRWRDDVTRDCLLAHDGRVYAIQSLHVDYLANIIQITAVEVPDKSPDDFVEEE